MFFIIIVIIFDTHLLMSIGLTDLQNEKDKLISLFVKPHRKITTCQTNTVDTYKPALV